MVSRFTRNHATSPGRGGNSHSGHGPFSKFNGLRECTLKPDFKSMEIGGEKLKTKDKSKNGRHLPYT